MGILGEMRRSRSRVTADTLVKSMMIRGVVVDSLIQCGLGDWAEGPVLIGYFPFVAQAETSMAVAFEPIERYVHEARAAGFRGEIFNQALGEADNAMLVLHDWRTRTSVHNTQPRGLGVIEVRSDTLDTVLRKSKFAGRSSMMWIDCEGAEISIFNGASKTLERVEAIICELKDSPKLLGWPDASQVTSRLDGLGYDLVHRVRDDGLFLKRWKS